MLHVHRAERADALVAALADVFATPLPDVLATELVAVHSRGIERWIAQELSAHLGTGDLGGDGVCANVAFPFPGRLVREAVAAGSGIDPDDDPWLPERLTWPLLEIVDADPTADLLGPLRHHLGTDDPEDGGAALARRFSAVRHVADLFDRYGVHRPEMVCRWRGGEDAGADGGPVPERHAWQPALWRAVRDRIDLESFAERRQVALDRLRTEPDLVDLPERFAMFGLTALPATYLDVVLALAEQREVHLLLLHPSRDLWDRVDTTIAETGGHHLWPRATDPTAALPRNPLLRSWGRDVRELQLLAPLTEGVALTHHDAETDPPSSLLERVQADVRADRHPGPRWDPAKPPLDPADRSVQLHDCHGRLRQVEVLRDVILHLLAEPATGDRPGLEPRDVIVMCPDIETFAPLVTAVFGADAVASEGDGRAHTDTPPALRVRLADRSLRRTNPVLDVVSQLLDLADGRVEASVVLDLLTRGPVQRRFGFTDEDVDTLTRWIVELRIRWGLDADHRRQHGLPAEKAHTWDAGLRRLLLGTAMADEDLRTVDGVVPFDGVEGKDADLAGRLVELVVRLGAALSDLTRPRPVGAWRDAIVEAARRLTATSADDAWQSAQLHRILDELVRESTVRGEANPVELTLAELRVALSERLAGHPSTTSHRTGDLTISTLVPMRSVPHRVVCLLGLDDGAFPRQTVPDSDDLLAHAPRIGDRDRRSEDRQLLLDAVLAAGETLVVTFAGRSERTNEDRPPAVPVDELRDVIDRTVRVDDHRRPSDHLTTRHPLTAYDPRNFEVGRLVPTREPWGFDLPSLAAARARRGGQQPPPPFLRDRLDDLATDVIDLDDLVAFLEHPVRAFVRQRLGVRLPGEDEEVSDRIPSSLRALDAWKVGDPMLQAWMAGGDLDRAVDVLRARGLIPPGELATDDLATIRRRVDGIVALCGQLKIEPRSHTTVDVQVELPDGRLLVGSVPDLDGWRVTRVGYSKVAPKHRVAAWARLLALVANEPGPPWAAVTAGRHPWTTYPDSPFAQELQLRGDGSDVRVAATTQLLRLIDLYERGMKEPLPLYCATSAKIAENLLAGKDPATWVFKEWETAGRAPYANEDIDPYHLLVLERQVGTDELFEELCRDVEETSWHPSNRRVVAYAWRLWEPILRTERRRWL